MKFTLDMFHTCFQESTLSAIIITFYMILSDAVDDYIDRQSITKWQKYVMSMSVMFIASFVAISFILLLFGHDCKKNKDF